MIYLNGIFAVLGQFLGYCGIIACFMAFVSKGINMLVKSIRGKEDIF